MKNMLERLREARAARQENREAGFSLIELIVVIAIIGILIAVAIPVYDGIQDRAKQSQLDNAAATAATQVAAAYAENKTPVFSGTGTPKIKTPKDTTVALKDSTKNTLDDFCVVVSAAQGTPLNYADSGASTGESGPGC